MWVQGWTDVMSLQSAGVGVPGFFHGVGPGQGLTLLLSPHFIFLQFYFVYKSNKTEVGLVLFWFIMVAQGFGGRGVLPGVAIGSNLNPKSSKNVNLTLHFIISEASQKSYAKKTKMSKFLTLVNVFHG